MAVSRLTNAIGGFARIRWSDVGKEIPVIVGYRGILIALAARAPLDLELVVMAAGFAANISGQAHIAWHLFFPCRFDGAAHAAPSTGTTLLGKDNKQMTTGSREAVAEPGPEQGNRGETGRRSGNAPTYVAICGMLPRDRRYFG